MMIENSSSTSSPSSRLCATAAPPRPCSFRSPRSFSILMSIASRVSKRLVFVWGDSKVGGLGGRGIRKCPAKNPITFECPDPAAVTAGWSHGGDISSDGLSYVLGRTHDIKNVFYISRMFRMTCRLVRVWKSIESPSPRYLTVPEDHLPKNDPIISMDTSACLTGIVTESGKAFLYGDNRHGQCGNGEPW